MADSDTVLLRRLIALRHVPGFTNAELDELAALADNSVETTLAAGEVVVAAGVHVPQLHLVLAGRIEMATAGAPLTWAVNEVFGTLEVLAGRRTSQPAIAAIVTRTLRLSGIAFADLLEDNIGILMGLLRQLARAVVTRPDRTRNRPTEVPGLGPGASSATGGDALGLVERLMLLRQQPLFARGKLQALSMLGQLSSERAWTAGATVVSADEPAVEMIFILAGTLRDSRGEKLGPGDSLGTLETIAGMPHAAEVVAETPVRALVSRGDAVVDVLEDHTTLGLAMLASLATILLDAESRGKPADERPG